MSESPYRYFAINKPYNMVSQFVSPDNVRLLGSLDFDFPEGTHAIGRLDNHSEGLLLLTTNKKVTRLLFEADVPHKRTYLVQVKDKVSEETLNTLRTGVTIRIAGGIYYTTPPSDVQITDKPNWLSDAAFIYRADLPHTWLLITLTEGKYHQVRKMVKAMHHRCQRLIRVSIEDMELGGLPAGAVKEYEEAEFFSKLKIDNYR